MRFRDVTKRKAQLEEFRGHLVAENEDELRSIIKNKKEVHIEIGTGTGRFITTLAKRNKDIFYIGIELKSAVLCRAVQLADENELDNVMFFPMNAMNIHEILEESSISRIYLNFSDPWHKSRHFKRRLTYRDFIEKYFYILKQNGEIHFKTDNLNLFEFSLNEFADLDLKIKNICLDLHNSDFENNIMTEYEEKFSQKGFKIMRCEIVNK